MPGDVVRRMTVKGDSQRGYCREIFVRADVKVVGTKYVIKNVASERLKPIITMPRDNAVCLDSWVGSTKNINEKLTLKSTCGSILEIRPDIEFCPLRDVDTKTRSGLFAGTFFYPGQTLIGNINELENAKWITTSPEMRVSRKQKINWKFTVESVDIEGVWVNWQCKASCDESVIDATKKGNGIQQPKCYVTGEDLNRVKRLNLFESCMLQINDKNYLKVEEDDLILRKSQWKKEQNNRFRIIKDQIQVRQAITKDIANCNKNKISIEEISDEPIPGGETIKLCTTMVENGCDTSKHKPHNKSHNQDGVCDKNKLCPSSIIVDHCKEPTTKTETGSISEKQECAYNRSKFCADSDEWKTEDDDETASMSDSNTTVSSCSSSATPKSSPKKSPLLVNKVNVSLRYWFCF